MKYIKVFESFSQVDENKCPVCEEQMVSQCKCGGIKHDIESLQKGHGKRCKNGHQWSYNTVDGKVIFLTNSLKPKPGKEYMISPSGSISNPEWVIEATDGSHMVDMRFSSPEMAKKFADERGFDIVKY